MAVITNTVIQGLKYFQNPANGVENFYSVTLTTCNPPFFVLICLVHSSPTMCYNLLVEIGIVNYQILPKETQKSQNVVLKFRN